MNRTLALTKVNSPAVADGMVVTESTCSVYSENFDKTVDMMKSYKKDGMLGHDFKDRDGQAITNETESDTGGDARSGAYGSLLRARTSSDAPAG